MSIHSELIALLQGEAAAKLAAPVELRQDALILQLHNGVRLEVRYAAADAYSLRWTSGEASFGIDTAPLHPQLASFPNHFHDAAGRVLDDPVTRPGATPADNLVRLIDALLADPALGTATQ